MSRQSQFLVAYLEQEFARLDRRPDPMPLTAGQRRKLFEGRTPKISYPGAEPCPVEPGHVEVLSPKVQLQVTAVRRTKMGGHSVVYVLVNNRIGQRFLAVQNGQRHPEQYDHSGGSSVDPQAGEAVDDFAQRRIKERSRQAERDRANEVILAVEDVRQAIRGRMDASPAFRRSAGRSLYRIEAELNRVVNNAKRKAA